MIIFLEVVDEGAPTLININNIIDIHQHSLYADRVVIRTVDEREYVIFEPYNDIKKKLGLCRADD